jgi:hypothetical protein
MSELDNSNAGRYVRGAQRDSRVLVPLLLVLVGALGGVAGGHVAALDAAGAFKGSEIAGAAHYISTLQEHAVWLGATAMGLAIVVIAILFMAGHSRAHDLALKTGIGLFILASVNGLVA